LFPFGLRTYDSVKEEPEHGFRVMVEFMPPMGIGGVRRNNSNIAWFMGEFPDAIRVVGLTTLRTYRYFKDITHTVVECHSPSQFNSTSDENRRALMTAQNVSGL